MYRVLRSGGRLVLAVGQSIEYSPGFAILVDKLASCISQQAAALLSIPFSLGDGEELHTLIVDAGFQDVIIRPEVKMIHFPSPAKFVEDLITGSSMASQVGKITLAQLINEVSLELQPFVKKDGLSFPMGIHFAVAHRR